MAVSDSDVFHFQRQEQSTPNILPEVEQYLPPECFGAIPADYQLRVATDDLPLIPDEVMRAHLERQFSRQEIEWYNRWHATTRSPIQLVAAVDVKVAKNAPPVSYWVLRSNENVFGRPSALVVQHDRPGARRRADPWSHIVGSLDTLRRPEVELVRPNSKQPRLNVSFDWQGDLLITCPKGAPSLEVAHHQKPRRPNLGRQMARAALSGISGLATSIFK